MDKFFVTSDQWVGGRDKYGRYPYNDGVHRGNASSLRDAAERLASRYAYARGLDKASEEALANSFEEALVCELG